VNIRMKGEETFFLEIYLLLFVRDRVRVVLRRAWEKGEKETRYFF